MTSSERLLLEARGSSMTSSERLLLEAIRKVLDLPAADYSEIPRRNDELKERAAYVVGCLETALAYDAQLASIVAVLTDRAIRPLGYQPRPQLDKALPSHG